MTFATITKPAQVAALVAIEEAEDRRAILWECVPVPARELALVAVHLPIERAQDPLRTFSRAERHALSMTIGILATHLQTIHFAMRDTSLPVTLN